MRGTSSNTAFAGILLRVSAAPALAVAAPAWLTVAVMIGGGYGESTLTFQELGELYVQSPALGSAVFILWALVMAPASRAGLMAPGLDYLRWLPLPRSLVAAHVIGLMAVLHIAPVVPLFAAGLPAEGIGMLSALVGAAACLLPGARGVWEQGARLAGAAVLLALVHRGLWVPAIPAGATIAAMRLLRVWRLAPELSARRSGIRLVRGGAWPALCCAQLLHVWRREAATLSRALLISTLGVFLILAVERVNQGFISEGSLLVLSTPALAAVSILVAIALKRARRGLGWTMRTLGISLTRERRCSLSLMFVASTLLAIAYAWAAQAEAQQIALLATHTAAWVLLALGISSRSVVDTRSASITLASAVLAMFAIGIGGRAFVVAELGLGLLVSGRVLFLEIDDA